MLTDDQMSAATRDRWSHPLRVPAYPLGVPTEGERKMRDPENTSKTRSVENTSSLRWVQPMVAGVVIGALLATITFLSIKNANDWLPPCAHVQQGACYTEPSTKELGD